MPPLTGTDIRAWRLAQRLTLQELASELGIALTTLYRWEQGENQPSKVYARLLRARMGRDNFPAQVNSAQSSNKKSH